MGTDWNRASKPAGVPFRVADLGLRTPVVPEPGAWFLGPKGENLVEMRELMVRALDGHAAARAAFHPEDPPFIDDATRERPAFAETMNALRHNLDALTRALRSSTPMTSYRNQSHMNWDITMPGALGYFAGMLFNPNNVAPEASPVTTALELQAGRDLCGMLGYGGHSMPEPWGHITCDGSVANTEAMWCARNLRFQAAALARAVRLEPSLASARSISVRTAQGTRALLLDLDPWQLVNLPNDEILALPRRMVEQTGLEEDIVRAALDAYSLQALGLAAFRQDVLQGLSLGVVIVPATAHYSWNKGVAILGLGTRALRTVEVDADARMSMPALRRILDECLRAQTPVIQLVAVAGSTAESAADPLDTIAELREDYAARGLSLTLHADAAWGGYFATMLRPPASGHDMMTPIEPLSAHVGRQLGALRHADTITVDPHKSGYIPYPAGALCYRDRRMIYLVAHSAPVVFHDSAAPSVGVYGIEGSKPGAAAAGVALSHSTIPLDQSGYGLLLGRCVWNAKRFCIGVTTLARPDDPFFAIPLPRLPSERRGAPDGEVAAERARLVALQDISNEALVQQLQNDPSLAGLFREIGPDLTVFAYAFNFLRDDGTPNTDPAAMNALNLRIFEALSVEEVKVAEAPPDLDMLVTSTLIAPRIYGAAFSDTFTKRARLAVCPDPLRVLISTMQDPWVSDTARGNFLPELMTVLRRTVLEARAGLIAEGA